MDEVPEKHETLRAINAAIAAANDEIVQESHVSTQRAKRYGRALIAKEVYEDAKALVGETTERATANFLREAAAHDVRHAVHKAEHRLAEARCQAVFKQRPFLQHLDKAKEAAAQQGHAKKAQNNVAAGPWRAAVVGQLDAFEASVRTPAHAGGLGLGPRGDASINSGDGDELIVGLRRLRRSVNACTGTEAAKYLEALRQRSAELAARVDPHLGRLTDLRVEAKRRVDETGKVDEKRAATLRRRAGGGELDQLRRDLHLKKSEMREAEEEARGDYIETWAVSRKPRGKAMIVAVPDEPSDLAISQFLRTRRAYLGADGEFSSGAAAAPTPFRPGGRVDEARALAADALAAAPAPYAPSTKSPVPEKRKARRAPAAANAKPRGPPPELKELRSIVVTRASESRAADRFYRFLVDCGTRGDWRKAVEAYRVMVSKGLAPDARTWRVLLRAAKVGKEGRVALVLLEEIEAQVAQRAGADGLVPVDMYNCCLEAAAAGGGWRRAIQVFNRMRHHGVKPNTSTYQALMAAVAKARCASTEVYDGLKYAGVPEYLAYTAAAAHALRWGKG
jgi:pentatricopeptide repeat protein